MCFEADTLSVLVGGTLDVSVPGPWFQFAPQRGIYPQSTSEPSPESVLAFLVANRIDYIYADAIHPNTLVPDAVPVATEGETQVLRVP